MLPDGTSIMEGILNHGLQALYKLYVSCSTWWMMIRICGRVNLSTSCESIVIQAFALPILRLGCDDPCSLFVILGQKESSYRTFVCNTICVFISQYSVGTNFCHLFCWIWTKLFCFQFQERFSTTSWRGIEIASIIQAESLLPIYISGLCKKDWIMPIQEMSPNQFAPGISLCTCPSSSVPVLPTLS